MAVPPQYLQIGFLPTATLKENPWRSLSQVEGGYGEPLLQLSDETRVIPKDGTFVYTGCRPGVRRMMGRWERSFLNEQNAVEMLAVLHA